MIQPSQHIKQFGSAKVRFVKRILDNFFKREFPKLIGPIVREKLIDELMKLLDAMLPLKDHLKPGQVVWNVVDIHTRADAPNPKFVPVVLTLINEDDIEKLTNGVAISTIMEHAIARTDKEAYAQGGLLSMRNIGLLTWRYSGTISKYRLRYEKEHQEILPHTGSLQDMGTCISHKAMIIKKVIIEKKDPYTVAKQTNHSMLAVDRYLKDFYRVQYCYNDNKDIEFTSKATGLNKFVVKEYFEILDELKQLKN
jgi:hypothetical protein